MSPQIPPAGPSDFLNATGTTLEFVRVPVLQLSTVTIFPPMNLSLWIGSDKNSTLSLTGTLREKPSAQGSPVPIVNLTIDQPVTPDVRLYNFSFPLPTQPLIPYTHLSVGVKMIPSPKANMTLYWGSPSRRSFVVIRLSGYEALSPNRPVDILDRSSTPTTIFDLNSTAPSNIVIFQASVLSAFGFEDISRVNMTLLDPLLRPVKAATNLEMSALPPHLIQPYFYTAFWIYPSNATQGTYQVHVDIIDVQNVTAFSFRGPATFGLQRASIFSRSPFNYLPYFSAGGAVVIGSFLYYRRRKTKKSYLVPFDYFNTLTGGELDGGTVVAVEGNTGAGKTLLSEQLMFEDLKKGRPCVFVATGDFPSNIRSNMKSMGFDVSGHEQSGLLTFVDGYSSEAGQESREKFSIPSLGDLTTLGVKISSSLPGESFKGGSLYFDSLTPLVSKTKPESIVSFVQSLGARVKGMSGKAFFTVGPSIDGKVQRQLEEMADCVVQMEAFEEGGVRKSRLRIAKYRARRYQQGWVIYTIEDGKGIIFYSKKPRR